MCTELKLIPFFKLAVSNLDGNRKFDSFIAVGS
jgi:hypothetical protein